MTRPWIWFRNTIRQVTVGAGLVTEILEAVLAEDKYLLKQILAEHEPHKAKLSKLITCAKKTAKSLRGRAELRRLADQYRDEAHWPTDDLTLRRAYEVYKSGRLATCLPAVDKLVSRLA